MFIIIAVNIIAFVASTDKQTRNYPWLMTLFPIIEAGSVGIFTVEFILRYSLSSLSETYLLSLSPPSKALRMV
jgi:hypothetical protein